MKAIAAQPSESATAPRTWAPILDRFVYGRAQPGEDPAVLEGRKNLAERVTAFAHQVAALPSPARSA